MPFVKVAGKWTQSAEAAGSDSTPERLVIVDKQVDTNGDFQRSLKSSCRVVNFDSKVHSTVELCEMVRTAHKASGKPFASMAFANHGPSTSGTSNWIITKDLEVGASPEDTADAIDQIGPLVEIMVASLEKAPTAHIAFMACSLAHNTFLPGLVPAMETLYGVDFMASTDVTGNETAGGDWELETDSFHFNKVYCDPVKLVKYRQTMPGQCFPRGC